MSWTDPYEFTKRQMQGVGMPQLLGKNIDYSSVPMRTPSTAQELTNLGGQGYGQQAQMDTLKQNAAPYLTPNPSNQAPSGLEEKGIGNIDFKALSAALGGNSEMEMLNPQIGTPKAPAQIQPIMIYGGQPAGPSGAMQAITGMGRGQASEEELRRLRGY